MRLRYALIPCLALFAACGRPQVPATEILWDESGLPHVFAAEANLETREVLPRP